MKRAIYLFSLFVFCLMSNVNASDFHVVYPDVMQQMEGTRVFEGDSHGEFAGDLVVVLTDGSEWKIHPDSLKKFQSWDPDDQVYIDIRSSFYWFKREHKFKLYNCNRKESVKVMLVAHKQDPHLSIVNESCYPTDYMLMPYYVTINGVQQILYYEEVPCKFEKILLLSDGSIWKIKDKVESFHTGMKVYVGANNNKTRFFYFLIGGAEREAVWTWAMPTYDMN